MNLVFQPTQRALLYAAYTPDGSEVYSGSCAISDWSPRSLQRVFQSSVLTKLKGHGKVFQRVGIIVPYAPADYIKPLPASEQFLKPFERSLVLGRFMKPAQSLHQVLKQAWPHLPHFFLFDTCLSHHLSRTLAIPPFSYDTAKALELAPAVLHSYGHKANLAAYKGPQPVVSVYIGDQVSVALLQDERVIDAIYAHGPLSPILSYASPGNVDVGTMLMLAEKQKMPELASLFVERSGIWAMTEANLDVDSLLQISGLVPRSKDLDLDDFPIESIEWIELTMRTFLRSLQQAIGALITTAPEARNIIVNTSHISDSSGLWTLLGQKGLADLKVHHAPTSLLQAAAADLNTVE